MILATGGRQSKKDNGDYYIKDLRDYFSSNKERVSRETFEKLNNFCLLMIFDFDKKKTTTLLIWWRYIKHLHYYK